MNENNALLDIVDMLPDPGSLVFFLLLAAFAPTLAIISTAFLKISVVLLLLRNALGLQEVPSNLAINSLALILAIFVMAPIGYEISQHLRQPGVNLRDTSNPATQQAIIDSVETMRGFLLKHAKPEHRDFFAGTARKMWADELGVEITTESMIVLIPAFTTSELAAAFQAAFLLYLPFLVIDLVVANVLLALGMMMLSPLTISLPFKLLLFVAVDGWTRLLQSLVMSYA